MFSEFRYLYPMKRVFLLFVLFVMATGCSGQTSSTLLPPKAFAQKFETTPNGQLIDVRTPDEFSKGHLDGAANIAWNGDAFEASVARLDKSKPVFVYCLAGGRSAKAAKKLADMGFTEVYDMAGGYMKWQADGMDRSAQAEGGMSRKAYDAAVQNGKVLVNFYADWCEPCRKMRPYMTKLEKSEGPVKIVRLDADKHKTLVKDLHIEELPTLFLYENGKIIWSYKGFIAEDELQKHL